MERYRVLPRATVDLWAWDAGDTGGFLGDKAEAKARLAELGKRLSELQRLLWAEQKQKLLVVLQAMDTGGKDGTIRAVMRRTNPQGVRVTGFGVPTDVELAHDYLWRIHPHTPASGEISIFNRSHYEDVLVVRVLGLVPEARWRRRYEHIRAFERMLADEGTTILKFYLHIDRETQKERLQARLDDPTKNWKFNKGDLAHRARWDDYMLAYEEAITETSTEHAPWFIVPSNRKWYRNLVVAETIVSALEGLDMHYPEPEEDLSGIVIE